MLLPIFLISVLAGANAWLDKMIKKFPNLLLDPIDRIPDLLDISNFINPPDDAYLTSMELISKYGYDGEAHKITTSDGYILEMHRITGRTNSTDSQVKKPIAFVMHGLMGDSAVWVFSGVERSLAFILADAGYDVWLGNARGVTYSREHTNKKLKNEKYWDFSWHEIGIYDLPAMIDYILKTTDQEDLFYLGHSQGTTSFFVMASERPEYQKKIKAMFAMAPIVYCGRMKSPFLQLLAQFTVGMDYFVTMIGMYEFNPTNNLIQGFQQLTCSERARTQPVCSNAMFLVAGFNRDQIDPAHLPVILGHVPAPIASKQLTHYGQLIRSGSVFLSGKFRHFDYGMIANKKRYNSITPPKYNIESVNVPIAIYYSKNDWLSNVKDVEKLYNELPNTFAKVLVADDRFNHLDYMWAKDVRDLVYDPIITQMKNFGK